MNAAPSAAIIPPDEEQHAIDAQILQRVAAGDASALGELYDRWSPALLAVIRLALPGNPKAEDVLHDVFVTIWDKANDFEASRGHAYPWALMLTRNRLREIPGADLRVAPEAISDGEHHPVAKPAPSLPAPSAELRQRILASIAAHSTTSPDHVVPFFLPAWTAWAAAGVFALASGFFAIKSFNVRGQFQSLRENERLARIEAQSLHNLLEAERLLSRQQIDALKFAQIDASALRTALSELKNKTALTELKISLLAAPAARNTPTARAVAVWNPRTQEGLCAISGLPIPPAGQDYQLWIGATPVNVVTVDPATGSARVVFKTSAETQHPLVFTLTLERQGGASTAEGPVVLRGE
ncbi:MAG: anti-sigma factor [Verrucomicrobia bacterium]|nr:anti-sigma factor [Verrucomicrobiota bacterium]